MMLRYGFGSLFGIGGFSMMIFMALFWLLIISGIIFTIRSLAGDGTPLVHDRTSSAVEILKERYARGEIDTEEYQTRLRQLQ